MKVVSPRSLKNELRDREWRVWECAGIICDALDVGIISSDMVEPQRHFRPGMVRKSGCTGVVAITEIKLFQRETRTRCALQPLTTADNPSVSSINEF